ncbi:MAG: phosphoenolpyruvate---glycerone phosphotransferase subunit DhaK [Clostridiales bacterium]|jgi:dihydroxyacetone kinase-like protein|nr:phosphoenolpyruvate---glycerone phosphotransferase subunit DhaK [Clostridiales bacterium]MDK2934223.1 phosphoenolpyruvate---glycerone phosphotransferase subunit DhaK [Clostridiales bacterium]
MRKLINDPANFVDEMLQGLYAAHPEKLKYVNDDLRCVVSAKTKKGKVGLATGGGSGHLPLFLGYVGEGMLDGCSVGGVFQSPSANQMLEVTKAIDSGAGVLYIYGNYGGDVMNFDMAAEMADLEGIRVEQVVAGEDVASAPKGKEDKRRGVAGIFYVYKIAGAYADEMASLDEVKRVAEKVCANVRTMGVALSPCTIPEVGKPSFVIKEGEMEIGMGIHGEPGIRKSELKPADSVVDEMLQPILEDLPFEKGDEVSVLINGLGATPREELYVLYRRVNQILKEKNIKIFHPYIGEFATSMEMAGASITLLRLDDELKRLLAKPANTPFFVQEQLEVR